jgi:amino acid adenylation domain-containing protein
VRADSVALDQRHGGAAASEEIGGEGPGDPSPDDCDVGRTLCVPHTATRLYPRAAIRPPGWDVADTEQSIPERFEREALRDPARVAIDGTAWRPSFEELGAAANRLADVVIDRSGAEPGRVAVLLDHDAPLFAAVLGVLKAGKTVVAVNPSDPPARLERIRRNAQPQMVLTDGPNRNLALRAGFTPVTLATVAERLDASPRPAPEVAIGPDREALLLYTSGSTGVPRGVIQTHRNVLHNVLRLSNGLGVRTEDRIVALASLTGGQGMATTWLGLLNGATLCPFPIMTRGVTGLPVWLEAHRITILIASASVFRGFARTLDGRRVSTVRLLRLGSEPALRTDFDAYRRHFEDGCLFANTYSSSEAGNITQSLLDAVADPPRGGLSAGFAADGIEVVVLDERGEEVAPGRTGEIVVRSDYLSPGYWRDPTLTAERYAEQRPLGNGHRLFRTGDLGRLDENGELMVVGRKDAQVKVRGNRVELPEVERAIAARPGVTASAVRASASPRGDVRLTAYVRARTGSGLGARELRRSLRETLPNHAVPTEFVFLDALPSAADGGIDRDRLASIELQGAASVPADAPVNETEELLLGIWSDALELDGGLGREDDFFELGGDSLIAAAIAAEVHAAFGVELELAAFVESPSLREMAELVDRLRADEAVDARPPLTRSSRAQPLPASLQQEHIWRSSRTPEESRAYTMAREIRISGPLDVGALRLSLDHIFRRHEMLRTTFMELDGVPLQIVHPAGAVDLPLVDLTAVADAEAQVADLLRREARVPFDLECGRLVRLRLVRIRDDEHRLLRINHHIISDAWSWRIFFGELSVLYDAYRNGEPPPVSDNARLQYADFAAWQRRYIPSSSERYRREIAWWRQRLGELPAPRSLPFARPAPLDDAPPSDGLYARDMEADVSQRLDGLGREVGATYFMVRVALFAAQLAREVGQDDVVLTSFFSTRHSLELQAMIGHLFNGAILRLRADERATFREWLHRVRAVVVETSARTEVPHENVLHSLLAEGIPRPRIHAIFGELYPVPPLRFAGLEVTNLEPTIETMPWEFSFCVSRLPQVDRCEARFDARLYDPVGVRRFLDRYERLAAEVSARPDQPLRRVMSEAQIPYARRSVTSRLRRLAPGRAG